MIEFLRRNRLLVTVALLLVVSSGLVVSRSGDRVRNEGGKWR